MTCGKQPLARQLLAREKCVCGRARYTVGYIQLQIVQDIDWNLFEVAAGHAIHDQIDYFHHKQNKKEDGQEPPNGFSVVLDLIPLEHIWHQLL